MNERHLVWIIPILLIVGYGLGYWSGLNIPHTIEFGLDLKTINYMESVNLTRVAEAQNNCEEKYQCKEYNDLDTMLIICLMVRK
jgi:hypothetical protein